MPALRYQQALAKALLDQMSADPSVCVLGEDVGHSLRGVTRGLQEKFGMQRVLDTPLSEQAFTSFATGAALSGMRPVVEYQIPSLLYLAFEQIVNQAHKFHLMTGGQASVPVTYLVPGSGARMGLAGQHSDNPYSLFVHAGVKTVVPSCADDAYGLLTAAIQDDDPVIVFAPAAILGSRSEVPDDPFIVPIGSGRVRREGNDVTILAVGHLVDEAMLVAEELSEAVSCEVVDPRSLYPMDWDLLLASVSKTRRLVVFDDSNISCGFAAEVVATVAEISSVIARPRRVTRADCVIPFAPGLEAALLPTQKQLVAAVHAVMEERP